MASQMKIIDISFCAPSGLLMFGQREKYIKLEKWGMADICATVDLHMFTKNGKSVGTEPTPLRAINHTLEV